MVGWIVDVCIVCVVLCSFSLSFFFPLLLLLLLLLSSCSSFFFFFYSLFFKVCRIKERKKKLEKMVCGSKVHLKLMIHTKKIS